VPPVANAYFIRQELTFGGPNKALVLPQRHIALTEHLPGSKGYSPLVKEHTVLVGTKHEFDDVRSVAEAKSQGLKFLTDTRLHNMAVRGTIPACKADKDCVGTGGKNDPDLICLVHQGYCAAPYARLHEECRSGVKECDPKGGPDGNPLVCLTIRGRKKAFCYDSCDPYENKDTNTDPKRDSRCGDVYNMRCYALSPSPTRPDGVCIHRCNSRAGNKAALIKECIKCDCGDGKLQYGETCDDGNTKNGDGCNKYCTLSTYTRCATNAECKGSGETCRTLTTFQTNTYCAQTPVKAVTKEKDEDEDEQQYRLACMEYDYCVPPDDRADWLGKKEAKK
jgi:cysteine-rich repeat protein